MKPVLLVAPYFVPRRRVGALRPFKFAIHLRKNGYNPTVLTLANPGSELTSKEEELLKDISVIEINSPIDRTGQTEVSSQSQASASGISEAVLGWIDKQTPMDTWIYLFKAKYSTILKQTADIKPQIIWATGDPWSGLWLGEKLAKDLNKPFVADFRDPWTLSKVNLRERSGFSSGWDEEAEQKIIGNADRVVFTSRQTQNRYEKKYPKSKDKFTTIYNSFDSVLAKSELESEWNNYLDPGKLNVIFFGRFRRLSPVDPITEALKVFRKNHPDELDSICIHSFGNPDSECLECIIKDGFTANFEFHKPVMPENMIPVLKSADILLLSTNMEREDIIPAKLWDYLSVEVPIFSILPNPEVGEIIMRSKSGIQVHPDDKNEIAEILMSFAVAKKNKESLLLAPEQDIPDRDMYDAAHTTKQLASIFDELTTDA